MTDIWPHLAGVRRRDGALFFSDLEGANLVKRSEYFIDFSTPLEQIRQEFIEYQLTAAGSDYDHPGLMTRIRQSGMWPVVEGACGDAEAERLTWVTVMLEICDCEFLLGLDIEFRERMLEQIEHKAHSRKRWCARQL